MFAQFTMFCVALLVIRIKHDTKQIHLRTPKLQSKQTFQMKYHNHTKKNQDQPTMYTLFSPLATIERIDQPTMYTFFSPLATMSAGMTHSSHSKLLREWSRTWQANGWKTKVLNIQHAKKHKHFKHFNQTIATYFPQVSEYDRMCFFRWLAMSVVGGGFMADYDTFPLEINATQYYNGKLPNGGTFTSFDGFVPALVSGSGDEWERMAHEVLGAIQKSDFTGFVSDMFALKYISETKPKSFHNELVGMSQNKVFGSIFYKSRGKVDCTMMKGKKAIHFSHYATAETAKTGRLIGYTGKSDFERALESRWIISAEFVRAWKTQCKKMKY